MVRSTTRYDLTALADLPLIRTRRRARWVLLGLAVAMILLALFIATSGFRTVTGNWSAGKAAFLLLPALVVVVAMIGRATAAPGAASVEVNDEFVALRFPSGRVWRQHWSSPRFRLPLERVPAQGSHSSVPIPCWVATGPRLGDTFLTEDAYNEILRLAAARGMKSSPGRSHYRGSAAQLITQ